MAFNVHRLTTIINSMNTCVRWLPIGGHYWLWPYWNCMHTIVRNTRDLVGVAVAGGTGTRRWCCSCCAIVTAPVPQRYGGTIQTSTRPSSHSMIDGNHTLMIIIVIGSGQRPVALWRWPVYLVGAAGTPIVLSLTKSMICQRWTLIGGCSGGSGSAGTVTGHCAYIDMTLRCDIVSHSVCAMTQYQIGGVQCMLMMLRTMFARMLLLLWGQREWRRPWLWLLLWLHWCTIYRWFFRHYRVIFDDGRRSFWELYSITICKWKNKYFFLDMHVYKYIYGF